MHDVIRDAAISIAKERYMYSFSDGVEVEECKRRKTLEDSRAILLTNDCVSELICESFEYKQLELFWAAETKSDTILNNFFEKTKELRVLCFSSQKKEGLPPSLCFLQNLRTLCMAGYKLDDVALIGELSTLEILDLSESSIEELPTKIGQLTSLRVLDLRECKKLRVIYPNIISRLTRLEELYMDFKNWDKDIEVVNGEKRNASLLELKHLVRLTSLQLRVPDIRMLSKDLFMETLERYKILIQVDNEEEVEEDIGVGLSAQISPSRYLAIAKHRESIILHDYGLETLLRRSHVLCFSELQGANNIVYELDKKGFQELKRLYLKGNDKMRYLINTMEHINCSAAFGSLESLSLVSLTNMEKISHGELAETFKRLSIIKVSKCERLKNLLPFSIATQLEKIEIKDCQMMEAIVTREIDDEQEDEEKIVDEFPHLCSMNLENATKLRKFCSKMKKTPSENEEEPLIADSTMPFFDGKFVSFPKLEELKLSGCDFTKIWDDQFQLSSSSFHNLTKLVVQNCNFMKNLFSSAVAVSLEQLCSLVVSNCRMMEETMTRNESMDKISFPKLYSLRLNNLPNLVSFSSGIFIEFPVLVNLYIIGCPAFESFIANTEQNLCTGTMPSLFNEKAAFLSLNKVVIEGMDKLRMIWQYDDEFSTANSFCKLKSVIVRNCKTLIKIIPSSMQRRLHNVRHLHIYRCEMVEEVFEIQMSNSIEQTYHVVPAQLKELRLENLRKLKHVWSRDPRGTFKFQDLQSFIAYECESLKNLFPTSVAKSLLKLQKLQIKNCPLIEEIVAEGTEIEPQKFVFPQVKEMVLVSLPNLVSFYPGLHTSSWPALTKLDMIGCMKVKVFASELCFRFHEDHELAHHDIPNQLQPLFSVEKVGIDTPRMMMISQDQLTAGIFGKLKQINVYDCKSLTKMFSSNILRRLHNLSKLVISNCEMMEEVFEIETSNYHHHDTPEATVPIHLTTFKLSLLPKLKHVWSNDPRGTFIFQDLQVLSVNKCQSLKNLCPTSVAKNLLRLQNLRVRTCGIEQIVAKEEGQDQAIHTFVFPQLYSLTLHDLPHLTCFYPGLHALRLPLLRWLQVSYFKKAKDLSLKLLRFQHTSRLIDHKNISPLFSIDKVTSSSQCEDPVGDQEECAGTLSCLKGLKLYGMPNLLHLRVESSQPQTVFENLIELDILRCGRIKKLVPSSISFQNLVTLKIRQCHGMPSLLTSQTARSMAQLKCLNIFDCKRIAEIIADEEEGEDIEVGEIIFSRLKTLILDCLPSLTSFYSGKYMLGFPDLENVTVSRCFELQSFSQHGHKVRTPKLHKLITVSADHRVIDDINTITVANTPMDLNTTLPELWKSHFCTTLQELFSGKDLAPSNPSIEQLKHLRPTTF